MTQSNKYLDKVAEQSADDIAAAEQAARSARFNDIVGAHRVERERLRLEFARAEEAASARAKKIGIGLGAAGLVGAGAYALHRHNQEKQEKQAAETYSMPLSDAIKEHKDLTAVLRSNNRKDELKELKEQGEELKDMLSRAKAS